MRKPAAWIIFNYSSIFVCSGCLSLKLSLRNTFILKGHSDMEIKIAPLRVPSLFSKPYITESKTLSSMVTVETRGLLGHYIIL